MMSVRRCKTLDVDADGYVRGETCCVLMLEPAGGSATPSHTAIFLLLGSAVNQDGRSSSLTAPSGPAQQRVIAASLRVADSAQQPAIAGATPT